MSASSRRERYATGAEIFAHCQAIARKYRLYENAIFQTKVTSIAWDESISRWIIETNRGDRLRARHVAVSQGPLAKVKLPGVPGIRSFKGKIFHSSRWDYEYTGGDASGGQHKLRDKRVAVIGTGATAVQIVPTIAPDTKHLYVVQRTPSAIGPRNNHADRPRVVQGSAEGLAERAHDELPLGDHAAAESRRRREGLLDGLLRARRCRDGRECEAPRSNNRRLPSRRKSTSRRWAKSARMSRRWSSDPATSAALQPWYNYLCKRPLFSDDFLQSFNRDNVSLDRH